MIELEDKADLQKKLMREAIALMKRRLFREALALLHRVRDLGGELEQKARLYIAFILRSEVANLPAKRDSIERDSEIESRSVRRLPQQKRPQRGTAPKPKKTRGRKKKTSDIVRRTPHMDVLPPPPLPAGEVFDIDVYADTSTAKEDEEITDLELEFPENVETLLVNVEVVPTRHFVVEGDRSQRITISRQTERSTGARFRLRVLGTENLETFDESPSVTAYFTYNSRSCGMVRRSIPIAAATRRKRSVKAPSRPMKAKVTGAMSILTSAEPPDLAVQILDPERGHRHFNYTVYSRHLSEFRDGKSGEWYLPKRTEDLVTEYFEEFTSEPTDPETTFKNLRGAGIKLFRAAPPLFVDAFWALLDKKLPLRSIYVVSEEPHFPWELMVPNRRTVDQKLVISPHALGAEFLVGRWIHDRFLSPRQRKVLRAGIGIAPAYQGEDELPHAAEEMAYVGKRFALEQIDPVTIRAIDRRLSAEGVSFVHFACHGEASGESGMTIPLDAANERLTDLVLNGMEEARKGCETNNPVVFLNACEVGRQQIALSGIGGFAPTFLDMGATAVIAPLWSIDDTVALKAAQQFYDTCKKSRGTPFAQIIRDLRRRSYEKPWQDSWAAYCFYGDPLAAQID